MMQKNWKWNTSKRNMKSLISNPHYLDIKNVFDVTRRTISEMMNEESPQMSFEILNVQEEEEMSDENLT
jgi:hypothetical protein